MQIDYTHITVLLDHSGSMDTDWDATVKGINDFMKEQKQVPGKVTFSVYAFDTTVKHLSDFAKSAKIPAHIKPAGGTALYDAFKQSTKEVGQRLANIPEELRPSKVVFCTVTDGGENASRETRYEEVKHILDEQQKKYNWQFTFLGASFDAKNLGASLGVQARNSWNYTKGMEAQTYSLLSKSISGYRGMAMNAQVGDAMEMEESNIK